MYKHIPKPVLCPWCNQNKKLELANISGKYLFDMSDWMWLCHRCHMKQDGRLDRMPNSGKKIHHNTSCLICGIKETYINTRGYPQWFVYENGYICSKCYDKLRHRLYGRRNNKK